MLKLITFNPGASFDKSKLNPNIYSSGLYNIFDYARLNLIKSVNEDP